MTDEPALTLSLTIEPSELSSARATTLLFRLKFTNQSSKSVGIACAAAKWSALSGWAGPSWMVAIKSGSGNASASIPMVHLRTYYGPPGHPPLESSFAKERRRIPAGRSFEVILHACWVPHALLGSAALSLDVLDPKGFDGLKAHAIESSSVIVFGRTKDELEEKRARVGDFLLREEVVAFVREPEIHRVLMTYSQAAQKKWFRIQKPILVSADASIAIRA